MAVSAVNATSSPNAAGLDFKSLMQIILQQLTYQDPLKPMDNFQFVSQLAQFSQIQIGQTTNDKLTSLLTAQSNIEAAGLLGKQVDIGSGTSLISGKVTAIAFDSGNSSVTIQTGDKQTISNINITSITQIREGS